MTETRTPGCITRVERKEDNYDYISEEDTPNEPRYNTSSYQLNTYKNETRKKILRELENGVPPKDIPELQNDVDSTNNSFERNKDQYSVAPIEPGSLQSRSRSHLLKFEYGDDRHNLGAQIRTLDNKIGSRKIENRNYQLNYNLIIIAILISI